MYSQLVEYQLYAKFGENFDFLRHVCIWLSSCYKISGESIFFALFQNKL